MTLEKFEEFKALSKEDLKDYLDARTLEAHLSNLEPLPLRRFLTFLKLLEFRKNKHLVGDIQSMQMKGNPKAQILSSYNNNDLVCISKHLDSLKVSYQLGDTIIYDKTTIDKCEMFYLAFQTLNHTDLTFNSSNLNLGIAKFSSAINNFVDLKDLM